MEKPLVSMDLTLHCSPRDEHLLKGSVQYRRGEFMLVQKIKKSRHPETGTCIVGYGVILTEAEKAKAVAKYNSRADVIAHKAEIEARAARAERILE